MNERRVRTKLNLIRWVKNIRYDQCRKIRPKFQTSHANSVKATTTPGYMQILKCQLRFWLIIPCNKSLPSQLSALLQLRQALNTKESDAPCCKEVRFTLCKISLHRLVRKGWPMWSVWLGQCVADVENVITSKYCVALLSCNDVSTEWSSLRTLHAFAYSRHLDGYLTATQL